MQTYFPNVDAKGVTCDWRIAYFRSEVSDLQAQLRALQHSEQDLATVGDMPATMQTFLAWLPNASLSPPSPSLQLQSGCGRLADALGCSVEGVAAGAMEGIILTRVNSIVGELQQTTLQVCTQNTHCARISSRGFGGQTLPQFLCTRNTPSSAIANTTFFLQCEQLSKELEQCRGELAAGKVSQVSTEDALKKVRREVKRLEADLKQAKVCCGIPWGQMKLILLCCQKKIFRVNQSRQRRALLVRGPVWSV